MTGAGTGSAPDPGCRKCGSKPCPAHRGIPDGIGCPSGPDIRDWPEGTNGRAGCKLPPQIMRRARASAGLLGLLDLGPAVAQRDRAVEYEAVLPRLAIDAEIALPLELPARLGLSPG